LLRSYDGMSDIVLSFKDVRLAQEAYFPKDFTFGMSGGESLKGCCGALLGDSWNCFGSVFRPSESLRLSQALSIISIMRSNLALVIGIRSSDQANRSGIIFGSWPVSLSIALSRCSNRSLWARLKFFILQRLEQNFLRGRLTTKGAPHSVQ
jgi:hypothetical protein